MLPKLALSTTISGVEIELNELAHDEEKTGLIRRGFSNGEAVVGDSKVVAKLGYPHDTSIFTT